LTLELVHAVPDGSLEFRRDGLARPRVQEDVFHWLFQAAGKVLVFAIFVDTGWEWEIHEGMNAIENEMT
jgi:hypothetical protein